VSVKRHTRAEAASVSKPLLSGFLTQVNMEAQSAAMAASDLTQHGYKYLNIDSGRMGFYDGHGRPIPNTATFPDIKAFADRVHANGHMVATSAVCT
jgi:hypothetical protein